MTQYFPGFNSYDGLFGAERAESKRFSPLAMVADLFYFTVVF